MCLILFSYQPNTLIPLVLGSNRDEYFSRPSTSAHFWEDHPTVLAGRDTIANGTWIGITKTGSFAAVTNYRGINKVNNKQDTMMSRGNLTKNFLTGDLNCEDYLRSIVYQREHYEGFNLLVGQITKEQQSLFYLNDESNEFQKLQAGIYGLSNHRLNSPWPKVRNGKEALRQVLTNTIKPNMVKDISNNEISHDQIRELLENPELAADRELPKTGLCYQQEKALSASFIKTANYGTRASTVISIRDNTIQLSEKSYSSIGSHRNYFSGKTKEFIMDLV